MALQIRTKEKLAEVLLDRDSVGNENSYYMLGGKPNITVWEPGLYGKEFNKTYGHYHLKLRETYEILFGEALALLQKRNEQGEVDVVQARRMKAGDTIEVPGAPWGHIFANIGDTYLITKDSAPDDPSHAQNDYLPIKEKQGMAYYIVSEGGQVKLTPNSHYKNLPEVEWIK